MIKIFLDNLKENGFNDKIVDLLSKCDTKELISSKELYNFDTKTVLKIIQKTDFLTQKENIPYIKTIAQNMKEDIILLFNIINIPNLDALECLKILNSFTKIPFVNTISNLLSESVQGIDYDWEYELTQKEHIIKDLEKQVTDLQEISTELKPQSKDVFEAIAKSQIIEVINYIEKQKVPLDSVNWDVLF